MRVGLLRHFRVTEPYPRGWVRAGQLKAWMDRYDRAPIVPGEFDLGGVPWKACLCSPQPRARQTAEIVFRGVPEVSDLFAEARFCISPIGGVRLPVIAWRLLLQLAWKAGHRSQRIHRDDLRRRVDAAADRLESQPVDTLVVSHAGLMLHLAAELRRRGFHGPRLGFADHARAYLYQSGGSSTLKHGLPGEGGPRFGG